MSMVSDIDGDDFSLNMKMRSDELDMDTGMSILINGNDHTTTMAMHNSGTDEAEAHILMEYSPLPMEKLDIIDPINSIDAFASDVNMESMRGDIIVGDSIDESYSYGEPSNKGLSSINTAGALSRTPLDFSWFNDTSYSTASPAFMQDYHPVHFTTMSCSRNPRPSKSEIFQYFKKGIFLERSEDNTYVVKVDGRRKSFDMKDVAIKAVFLDKTRGKKERAYYYLPNYDAQYVEVEETAIMSTSYPLESRPHKIRLKTYNHRQAKGTKRVSSCIQLLVH